MQKSEPLHSQGIHKFHKAFTFDISSPRGVLHIVVIEFLGSSLCPKYACEITALAGEVTGSLEIYAQSMKSECQQPLAPQPSQRSTTILQALAARDDDKAALDFVHKRSGLMVGRAAEASKVTAADLPRLHARHAGPPGEWAYILCHALHGAAKVRCVFAAGVWRRQSCL